MSIKKCPLCGAEKLSVKDSRSTSSVCTRRYKCDGCGKRFSTIEEPTELVGGIEYKQLLENHRKLRMIRNVLRDTKP